LSKQTANKQPLPAALIAACETDIARLEREREAHVARGAELAGTAQGGELCCPCQA
jgi:hypothetical protein